jgi:hypothetical protein
MLFPFSVTISTIVAVLLAQQALNATDPFRAAGYTLVATMMVLAILEHWFLVLPISAARVWNWLWQWSLSLRGETTKAPRSHQGPVSRQATIGGRP